MRKEAAEMRVAGMKSGHVGAGSNSVHGALSKMDNSEALKAMMVGREGEQRGEKRNIDQVSLICGSFFYAFNNMGVLVLTCGSSILSQFAPHMLCLTRR